MMLSKIFNIFQCFIISNIIIGERISVSITSFRYKNCLFTLYVIGCFWTVYSQSTNPPKNNCLENRVEVLEDALTNIYQKFNDLVNTLNDKQKIVFDCLDKTCKNMRENDALIFVTIQHPYLVADHDRQNLQCANEVLVEQIRTEMTELMVSYNYA